MAEALDPLTLTDAKYEYHFVCHTRKERRRATRLFAKEKGTVAWIDAHLRSDDVFYDIGANIGVYTIFAGRRLGDHGCVVSFEPHISNAHSLIENIMLNGLHRKALLVTSALTNEEGYDRFNYQSIQVATAASQYGRTACEGEAFEPELVEVKHGCTVDALVRLGQIPPPSMVKIDVDGLELQVLEGMREVLASPKKPRSLQTELGTASMSAIVRFMEMLGYTLVERHWTEAALQGIAEGHGPETYPHNGIFVDRNQQ